MNKRKELISILLAAALLLTLLYGAAALLLPSKNSLGLNWRSFSLEPENSIDIFFVGSSITYCGIIPASVCEQTGLGAYLVSGPELTMPMSYYYVRQACKTQSPKLIVLELSSMLYSKYEHYNSINISYMPWGTNRLEAIFNAAVTEDIPGLLLPILDYHDRWCTFTPDELMSTLCPQRDPSFGYTGVDNVAPQSKFSYRAAPDDSIYEENLLYLKKLSEYCNENSIQLWLYISPQFSQLPEETAKKLDGDIKNIVRSRYIDFNRDLGFSELGLDPETDWCDSLHLNHNGALKLSSYFSKLLIDSRL